MLLVTFFVFGEHNPAPRLPGYHVLAVVAPAFPRATPPHPEALAVQLVALGFLAVAPAGRALHPNTALFPFRFKSSLLRLIRPSFVLL